MNNLKQIQRLSLGGIPSLSNDSLGYLPHFSLNHLTFTDNNKVTDDGIKVLCKRHPELITLSLKNTKVRKIECCATAATAAI